jgi:predicted RNA-binding protein with TRAM domain
MPASEELLCLYSARVERRDGSYVIEVPQREIDVGAIEDGGTYRVAMIAPDGTGASTSASDGGADRARGGSGSGQSGPPVAESDVLDVEIEDIGDKGDGIARVGPGYVIIIPDTRLNERVAVEITDVRENMAFAEVVERYDRPA